MRRTTIFKTSNKIIGLAILLFFVFLVLLTLSGCEKNQNSNLFSSTVEVRSIDLNSEVAGRITKVYFNEGDRVKKGDIIAEIDPTSFEIQLDIANINYKLTQISADIAKQNLEISKLKNQLLNQKPSSNQINQIKENILQLTDLKEGNERNISLLEDVIKKIESAPSNQDVIQKITELKLQLNTLKSQNDALLHQINSLKDQFKMTTHESVTDQDRKISDISIKIARDNYLQALSSLEIAKKNIEMAQVNLKKTKIISPVDGTLFVKGIEEGQFIGMGTFVAQIGTNDYYVKVYVPSQDLNKLSLGKEVGIFTDDNQKAYGKVVYISNTGEFTPRNIETKDEKQKVVFMVKINITKNKQILRPGMIVDVKLY